MSSQDLIKSKREDCLLAHFNFEKCHVPLHTTGFDINACLAH